MSLIKTKESTTMKSFNKTLVEKAKEIKKDTKQRSSNKIQQLNNEQENPPPGNSSNKVTGQEQSTKKDQYLIPGGMGWGLRNHEDSRPHHIFQSKEQAIRYAQNKSEHQKSRLIILEKNGEIEEKAISITANKVK